MRREWDSQECVEVTPYTKHGVQSPLEKWAVVDCSLQYWLSPGMVKKEAWVGEP